MTLVGPEGTSAVTSADQFVYGPTLTSFTPTSGPAGSTVTIIGTGFNSDGGVAGVFFNGGIAATSYTVVSDTTITAVVPSIGFPMTIYVETNGIFPGQANTDNAISSSRFTPTFSVPTITSVSTPVPNTTANGPMAGGTTVTINGTGLSSAYAVYFGGTPASWVSIASSSQITAVSPPATDNTGYVNVTVVTLGGISSVSNADQFVYGPDDYRLHAHVRSDGRRPAAGGTTVTLTGTGFKSDGGVAGAEMNGGKPVTSFHVSSDTSMTVVTPSDAGSQYFWVTTNGVPDRANTDNAISSGTFTFS